MCACVCACVRVRVCVRACVRAKCKVGSMGKRQNRKGQPGKYCVLNLNSFHGEYPSAEGMIIPSTMMLIEVDRSLYCSVSVL